MGSGEGLERDAAAAAGEREAGREGAGRAPGHGTFSGRMVKAQVGSSELVASVVVKVAEVIAKGSGVPLWSSGEARGRRWERGQSHAIDEEPTDEARHAGCDQPFVTLMSQLLTQEHNINEPALVNLSTALTIADKFQKRD